MRHGRAKAARKTLKFYHIHGDIRPPYKIVLDGNFLVALIKTKMELHQRIGKVLQNEPFNLFVTRAALRELSALSEAHREEEAFRSAHRLGLDECTIIEDSDLPPSPQPSDGAASNVGKNKGEEKAGKTRSSGGDDDADGDGEGEGDQNGDDDVLVSPQDAILRLVNYSFETAAGDVGGRAGGGGQSIPNPERYFVATQDEDVADVIRTNVPNVPLLRVSQSVLLLEAPTSLSRRRALRGERGKASPGQLMTAEERDMVTTVREQDRAKKRKKWEEEQRSSEQHNPHERRKKTKAKGPNPLSCKKKKDATTTTTAPRPAGASDHKKEKMGGGGDDASASSKRKRNRKRSRGAS